MDRDGSLIAYYARGFSMRETAKKFKISLERVRQILRANKPSLIRSVGDTRANSSGFGSRDFKRPSTTR